MQDHKLRKPDCGGNAWGRKQQKGKQVDLQDLMDALSDPRAYLHPVVGLHMLQTHASCVFLTGEYAYKIKKPVNFGFLDYGTLERRRRCCERELQLNRRLCPEVYLDLVPIGWLGGRLCIRAPGPPVEWAVRMRQLPEEDMLPVRLASGKVAPADIERIANVLVDFHGRALANSDITQFGAPEAIWRNMEENFHQTEPRIGEALPREHLDEIREYSREFIDRERDLLLTRMRKGRVRDGHGDLRAQNLCLYAGLQAGLQVLDCIEFNDRFRYEDVAADLAYLAMDLDLVGRADLRQVLIDQYVERSADPDLRRLLSFYCCYRAYVRGKIALLAAEEAEVPAAERQSQHELAATAFDLSRSYATRRNRPVLLLMSGYSGSGKSALAHELSRRLPAVRLTSDGARKELEGVAPAVRLPGDRYTSERRSAVYAELRRRATAYLARGENVILDATFLDPEERERAATLAEEWQTESRVIACHCPDAVIRMRLTQRATTSGESDADVAVYEAQLHSHAGRFKQELERTRVHWIAADTDQPARLTARTVMQEFWGG